MSSDKEATSDHSLLVRLDVGNDEVCPSGYDPMTKYPMSSQERESLAHFSEEEEKEEEKEEEEENGNKDRYMDVKT